MFPFLRHHLAFYSQSFSDKVKTLKKHRKRMLKKRAENLDLFKEHVAGLVNMFEQTGFYRLLSKRELFRKKGFMMLILRDILTEKYIREEDRLFDFHEEDEYFERKKPPKPKAPSQASEKAASKDRSEPSGSERDSDSDDEGRSSRRNYYLDYDDDDDDDERRDNDERDARSESDTSVFEQNLGGDEGSKVKPFLIRFFEEYARRHFDKMQSKGNLSDLEQRMSEFLCYFFVMNQMDEDILSLLFRATRHVRFRSDFGEILLTDALDKILDTRELLLDHHLINELTCSFFSNLGEALKAINLSEFPKFLASTTDLYDKVTSDRSFRAFLKNNKEKKSHFKRYEAKLELFRLMGAYLTKQARFFGQEQVRFIFAVLWNCDDEGVVFFQNIKELKETNPEFQTLAQATDPWEPFHVNRDQLDLFLESSAGDDDLSKVVTLSENRVAQTNSSKTASEEKLRAKLRRLRENSQGFESIAERFILLAILTESKDEPTFQELLHMFFCRFMDVILKEKLYLTYQGNFTTNAQREYEEEDEGKVSHTVTLFGVLINLSRNLLEMVNFIIREVKGDKDKYRRVLSFLYMLKNHNFITILIDKLTLDNIKKLQGKANSDPVLKAFQEDRIKQSELDIIRTCDASLAKSTAANAQKSKTVSAPGSMRATRAPSSGSVSTSPSTTIWSKTNARPRKSRAESTTCCH